LFHREGVIEILLVASERRASPKSGVERRESEGEKGSSCPSMLSLRTTFERPRPRLASRAWFFNLLSFLSTRLASEAQPALARAACQLLASTRPEQCEDRDRELKRRRVAFPLSPFSQPLPPLTRRPSFFTTALVLSQPQQQQRKNRSSASPRPTSSASKRAASTPSRPWHTPQRRSSA